MKEYMKLHNYDENSKEINRLYCKNIDATISCIDFKQNHEYGQAYYKTVPIMKKILIQGIHKDLSRLVTCMFDSTRGTTRGQIVESLDKNDEKIDAKIKAEQKALEQEFIREQLSIANCIIC